MRIAIDTRWIFREISGIGAHTRELVRYLALLDSRNTYTLLFSDRELAERTRQETGLSDKPNFRIEVVPWGIFSPSGQILLPFYLKRQRIDVYHSTNYMIPLAAFPRGKPGRTRCVATIHDLIPLLFPQATPNALKTRLYPLYRRLMREVGARADRIITVSDASRADVLKHLDIPAGRHSCVVTIHNGVSPAFHPPPAGRPAPGDTDTPANVLYVGRRDPYKNLVALVEAFAEARARIRRPLRLVIIGPSDPRYPEADQRIAELGLASCVLSTGYQDASDLVRAYQTAAVTVLASRYEGFGLPVVESMACGTPVVCSDIPVLREIAGQAALYAPPDDTHGLAQAILDAVTDAPRRKALIQQGLARAAAFTWEENARRTIALYETCASNATEDGRS